MKMVSLRNGAEEAEALVSVTMMSLRHLAETNPISFYELVMKCRDHNHQFFGESEGDLKTLSLVQENGSVHDSVRNVVLSAATGEGLEMTLKSPLATT